MFAEQEKSLMKGIKQEEKKKVLAEKRNNIGSIKGIRLWSF